MYICLVKLGKFTIFFKPLGNYKLYLHLDDNVIEALKRK